MIKIGHAAYMGTLRNSVHHRLSSNKKNALIGAECNFEHLSINCRCSFLARPYNLFLRDA